MTRPAAPPIVVRMPPAGTVVYLNGIAASGKSTLARGLQARWPEPYLHVGLDWITETMPRRFLFDGPDADLGARWVTDGNGRLLRIEAGPYGERLLAGLPRLAAALARAGNHVIVDDVLLYPWRATDAAAALAGLDAHLVEVRCDRETARARGHARGPGGGSGMTDAYYDAVYAHDDVDLRIDTGAEDPDACAERLVGYLRSGAAPGAFGRLATAAG